jgi:tetratricopeptide (TPR) repeat protein
VALVAGDAGSGKSALLVRLRDTLAEQGWRTAAGRCPEADGGSPAWAWAQALRALAKHADPGDLRAPLAPLLGDDAAISAGDALQSRFRLHRAVGDWFSELTDRPLVVLLDDMHRADTETRALLASLLDQDIAARVLFVAAYRPESDEGLDDLLATLARRAPTRVRLQGLDPLESADLIASVTGTAPDPAVVAALAQRTDGNPFYLLESARLLASEGELVATSQVPEGVADVLRRRFARLPEETVSILRLASVVGRDVDVALLIQAAEVEEDAVLDALEAGLISGLLVEPSPATVRFSHLLVRETLYTGVPRLRRVRWHARIADAVAALYPADLSALAHHAVQAASETTAADAAQHAVAAAELAESRYAYDSAADLYRQALRCLDMVREPSVERRVEVLAQLVNVLVRGGASAAALAARRELIALADASGDNRLRVLAITAWNVPTPWTNRSYGRVDEDMIATIERVLDTAELTEPNRGRILCTLVRETSFSGNPRTALAAEEAYRIAHEVDDPELLGMALMARAEVFLADVHPVERDALCLEMEALAERHGMVVFALLGQVLRAQSASVRLDLPAIREHLDQAATIAREYQMRQAMVVTVVMAGMLAHLSGDLDQAEALYYDAYQQQQRIGGIDADDQFALAMITLRFSANRQRELVDRLRQMYGAGRSVVAEALALALVQAGELDEAQRIMAVAEPPLVVDYLWLLFATLRALAVAAVGASDRAPELYEMLLPHRHEVAGGGTSGYVLTPVARALGHLARVMDRHDDAVRHFEEARAVAQRCGSAPWLALIEMDLATLERQGSSTRSSG